MQNDCSGAGSATGCIALPTDGTSTEIQTPDTAYLFLRSIEAYCDDPGCMGAPDMTWSCPNGTGSAGECCGYELVIKGTVEYGFNIEAP